MWLEPASELSNGADRHRYLSGHLELGTQGFSLMSYPCKLSALLFGSCVSKGPFIEDTSGTVGLKEGGGAPGTCHWE